MTSRRDIADAMTNALASSVTDRDVVGVGLGTPLALAAVLLARATHAPGVTILAGGAFNADADMTTYLGPATGLVGRTAGYVPHFDSMDMAARQAMTLQFLRPAQVDGKGNLNTSRIGPRERPQIRFPGGLATADVPMLLPRLVVYVPDHRPRNLPAEVGFITGAGGGWHGVAHQALGVVRVVTDLAVIEITPNGGVLESVHPWATVDQIVEETGFDLETSGEVATTPRPDDAQRAALRRIDPDDRRVAEIRDSVLLPRVAEEEAEPAVRAGPEGASALPPGSTDAARGGTFPSPPAGGQRGSMT